MSRRSQQWIFVLVVLYVGWGLIHLVLGAWYAPPNAEDFALSVAPKEVGKLNSVIQLLVYFDSRYTTNILHAVNPLVFNCYHSFYLITCFTLFLFIAAFYFFIGGLAPGIKHTNRLLMAAAAIVTFYAHIPSLPFGLYYMASTFTYIYPAILWLVWVGCWLRIYYNDERRFYIYSIVGLVTLLFSFGCSELFVVINLFTLAGIFFTTFGKGKTVFWNALPFFLTGAIAMLLILNFPSRKIVAEKLYGELAERYPGSNFLVASIGMYGRHFIKFFIQPSQLFILFIYTYWVAEVNAPKKLLPRSAAFLTLLTLFFSYVLCWAYFVPRGSSVEDPVYVFNVALFVAFCGFVFVIPIGLFGIEVWHHVRNYLPLIMAALLFAVVVMDSNYTSIRADCSSGLLQAARNRQNKFYNAVDSVKQPGQHKKVVYFELMKQLPQSVSLPGDLLPNRQSEDWNLAYELYFDIDEVRLEGDTIFK